MTRSARNCPSQPLRNPLAALTPIASPVHDQQAEIADRFAAHDEEGEDEDGEYVDETAELYDPEAEDAAPVAMACRKPEFEPQSRSTFEPSAGAGRRYPGSRCRCRLRSVRAARALRREARARPLSRCVSIRRAI